LAVERTKPAHRARRPARAEGPFAATSRVGHRKTVRSASLGCRVRRERRRCATRSDGGTRSGSS
jgi:hypothetical protein